MNCLATLKIEKAKHGYDVEVTGGYVRVYANNRDQAARMAEKAGYTVRSVNMIG